ncbi:MAG: adenylate/guanylate cyclase domain-containing protein [Leptospira sp.]|nr:adenylate/guanylate cyclase domain-containing protein [Leptospira sp.]
MAGIFSTFLFMICFFTLRHDHPEAIANKLQMVGLSYFIEISFYIIITGLLSGLIANQARKMLAKLLDSVKKNEFVTNVLGEYVSQEVKNKILDEGGLQIEGEEKEITVLFADLRNFTTISEDRTPKEIVSILNEYFDTMVETIQKNGGVIDKFIGDAIMAYFGAPIHMNNPQQKAFNAAKEMMLNINEINIKLGKRNLPILKQGIGLHHGVVVIGNIGSKTRKNYTIIGDTVNLASRLESLTKEIGKELIISDAVIKNLDIQDQNKFEIIRDINIRGKKDLISVYSYNLQ